MKQILKKIFSLEDSRRDRVWDLLDKLAARPADKVCCGAFRNYRNLFRDERLYCYTNGSDVLVVVIDHARPGLTPPSSREERAPGWRPDYDIWDCSGINPALRLDRLLTLEFVHFIGLEKRPTFYGLFITADPNFRVSREEQSLMNSGCRIRVLCGVKGAPDRPLDVNPDPEDDTPYISPAYTLMRLVIASGESSGRYPSSPRRPSGVSLRQSFNDDVDLDEEALPQRGSGEGAWDVEGAFPDGVVEVNEHTKIQLRILHPEPRPRRALDRLEGCAGIRARIDELVALTAFNARMARLRPFNKTHAVSLHSVFLGNPGTGKTTVCQIFGSLLREAGVLSLGHVVVCDRGSFIGTLWGDTERAVEKIVEQARGGVLMIDEAYLLHGSDERDPARTVLPQLMTLLADETRRDIAVVLCGYREPMLRLLETNPGLDSRFPNRFDFPDFSVAQLEQITRSRIGEYGYSFTAAAWEKYRRQLAEAYDGRDPRTWGNARMVANYLERLYVRHAARCMREDLKAAEQLLQITEDDVPALEAARPRKRIGF